MKFEEKTLENMKSLRDEFSKSNSVTASAAMAALNQVIYNSDKMDDSTVLSFLEHTRNFSSSDKAKEAKVKAIIGQVFPGR